ncbi:hypothetical protein HPB50_015393 [Hyalomma asiaticum]|uniref:Uncharacterized protein n=1 Tax=Hyalomma asiaticum TaxID=266040 RepID=A0ACB7TKR5_HYAAI|nr:hypothetical protein HPB50_015393 [Hyalomma asiaticum]
MRVSHSPTLFLYVWVVSANERSEKEVAAATCGRRTCSAGGIGPKVRDAEERRDAGCSNGKKAAAPPRRRCRRRRGPSPPPHAPPSSRLRNAAQAASMTRPLPLLLPVVLVAAAASGARCPQDQDRWDASNKALTASLVFQGRLLSKSVDAAGNLLARFRVQKVLKPMPTATLRRRQEVVVALVKSRPPPTQQHSNRSASPRRDALTNEALAPRRRTLCPVSVPQGFVFNARYLVYANPVAGRAARRLLLPAAANFSAAATPDHYTRRAGRAVKKVVCNGCGECDPRALFVFCSQPFAGCTSAQPL